MERKKNPHCPMMITDMGLGSATGCVFFPAPSLGPYIKNPGVLTSSTNSVADGFSYILWDGDKHSRY